MKPALPLRVGVLSFAHYHANFWSEVFAERGVLAGIWDDDIARGRDAAARFGTMHHPSLEQLAGSVHGRRDLQRDVAACRARRRGVASRSSRCCARSRWGRASRTASASCEPSRAADRSSCRAFPSASIRRRTRFARRLRSGELGRITLARVRHGHFYGLQPDFRERWYVRRALSGGGALLDEGVHAADLLAWLFGMPRDGRRAGQSRGPRARGRGSRHRRLPMGVGPDRRDRVELHVRRGGHVGGALRHAGHAAAVRRRSRLARHHGRRIHAPLSQRDSQSGAGRRSTSCRASSRRFPSAECDRVRRCAGAGKAASDLRRRRPQRVPDDRRRLSFGAKTARESRVSNSVGLNQRP